MSYCIYLRDERQQVSCKTLTVEQEVARAAFAALSERVELDGQRICAVLNHRGATVALHDFSRPPPPEPGSDPRRWWRGNTGALPFYRSSLKAA